MTSDSTPAEFPLPADAPDWFRNNLQHPGESRMAHSDGVNIHYLCWNWDNTALPALLLVHGFGGHAYWWSFLAPFFTDRYRVAAIDLPGMGDSGYPPVYHDDCFANGILAVLEQNQLRDATLIGHSFGGLQSLRAMLKKPEYFQRGIVVDSLVCLPPQEPPGVIPARGSHTAQPSREACMARFRLMPPQPAAIDAIQQYLAFHSCKQIDSGWVWKFDPNIRNFGEMRDVNALQSLRNRVDLIYGEQSMFNHNDMPARLLEHFGNPGELILVPNAHHHLMVDQPLALVAAINRLLEQR